MEIIFEALGEILLEGCFEIIKNKKNNIVIRALLLSGVTIIYSVLVIGSIILAIKATEIIAKIVLSIIGIIILAFLLKFYWRLYR